jgi:hypothetical protein
MSTCHVSAVEAYIEDDTLEKVSAAVLAKLDSSSSAASIALVGEALLHTTVPASLKLQVLQKLLSIKIASSSSSITHPRSEELNAVLTRAVNDCPALFAGVAEVDILTHVIKPLATTIQNSLKIQSIAFVFN